MYTGTLIDELIATVERTEARADNRSLLAGHALPGRKTCLLVRGGATGSCAIRIQSGWGGINGGGAVRSSDHAA